MEAIDSDIQYRNSNLEELAAGHSFRIHGNIPENGNLFTIDFITNLVQDTYRNIALRITIVVNENFIIRSSRVGTEWSLEEFTSATPYILKSGKHVMIEVLTLDDSFLIALNGFHCANYLHRQPINKIKILEIRGHLDDIIVDRKITKEYPQRPLNSPNFGYITIGTANKYKNDAENYQKDKPKAANEQNEKVLSVFDENDEVYNEDDFMRPKLKDNTIQKKLYYQKDHLPVPYFASFDKGLFGMYSTLTITGRVRANAKAFTVSLQGGRQFWPAPSVCYYVKFKFFDQTVDDSPPNKCSDNEVVRAEYGDIIKLLLKRNLRGFTGFINNQKLAFRPYQTNPVYINTILVDGDLKLMNILIEG